MSWTDERISLLKNMWSQGSTAMEIAETLGGVSRNAVIGKAHRLGLQGQQIVTTTMLGKVSELPLSKRTQRLIANDNIIFVGDLIQKTEAELLRMPEFGVKSLNEVKAALAGIDLRPGMWVPAWPPEDIATALRQTETARRVAQLRQSRGGATFQPDETHFAMASEGEENDRVAALKSMTRQMQSALIQKALNFANLSARLDNQPGWSGISRAAVNIAELLNRAPEEIPDVLGLLYPAAIELGSFIELDEQLKGGEDSYAAPLDPEVRRPLSDLVRNLAPWLRAFPSVREADDEASRFLVQAAALTSTFDVVRAAGDHEILPARDLDVFRQLHDAAKRGTFQGEKAGGRAKRSATNLVISVVAFAGTVFTGAIASDVATTSPLAHKVGQFLVHTEKSIESLLEDMPQDLRYSIADFLESLPGSPIILPQSPKLQRKVLK